MLTLLPRTGSEESELEDLAAKALRKRVSGHGVQGLAVLGLCLGVSGLGTGTL